MLIPGSSVRSPISRRTVLVAVAVTGLALVARAGAARPGALTLQGSVRSGDTGLAGYSVSVYAAFVDRKPQWMRLGSDTSDGAGNFEITYSVPGGLSDSEPLLFVEATRGRPCSRTRSVRGRARLADRLS